MSEEKKELDQGGPVEGTAGEEKAAEKQSERLENSVYDWARSLIAAVVGVVLLFTFFARRQWSIHAGYFVYRRPDPGAQFHVL